MSAINLVSVVSTSYVPPIYRQKLFQIERVEELTTILQGVETDDLVLFDVDEVLITPRDQILRIGAARHCDPLYDKVFFPPSDVFDADLYAEWVLQTETEVINQELIHVIQGLQARSIKIIALTKMYPGAGACGKIAAMEELRFRELKKIGIDFSQSFPVDRLEFDLPPLKGRTPLFKDGIIYARPYLKREALREFLNKMNLRPKKVWFVDNEQEQINCVAKGMKELQIPYIGVQFLDRKLVNQEYDKKLGEFQFTHFATTKVWLNDNAAKALMYRENV